MGADATIPLGIIAADQKGHPAAASITGHPRSPKIFIFKERVIRCHRSRGYHKRAGRSSGSV